MVAREQHRRDRAEFVLDRTRVMRAVQQAVGLEAVLDRRFGIVQRPVLEPRDGIHDHRGRQFASGKHVVADRQFLVHLGRQQALVHALVAPAQQDQPLAPGQFAHPGLGQRAALGTEIDDPGRGRVGSAGRADRRAQRVDHHHHARPPAEGTVVDAAIVALGVVARIPAVDRQQAALLRAPDHAERGALGDELGEQADDIDAHGPGGLRSPRPSRP